MTAPLSRQEIEALRRNLKYEMPEGFEVGDIDTVCDMALASLEQPESLHPHLVMAAGNHHIGVFKDGKLIAADSQVYAQPGGEVVEALGYCIVNKFGKMWWGETCVADEHIELDATLESCRDDEPDAGWRIAPFALSRAAQQPRSKRYAKDCACVISDDELVEVCALHAQWRDKLLAEHLAEALRHAAAQQQDPLHRAVKVEPEYVSVQSPPAPEGWKMPDSVKAALLLAQEALRWKGAVSHTAALDAIYIVLRSAAPEAERKP